MIFNRFIRFILYLFLKCWIFVNKIGVIIQKKHIWETPESTITNDHCKDLTNMPFIAKSVFIYNIPYKKQLYGLGNSILKLYSLSTVSRIFFIYLLNKLSKTPSDTSARLWNNASERSFFAFPRSNFSSIRFSNSLQKTVLKNLSSSGTWNLSI